MSESPEESKECEEAVLDTLCETLESAPAGLGPVSSSVRAYCRTRRSQLSRQGKQALSAGRKERGRSTGSVPAARRAPSSPSGRALAKAKRLERCRFGQPTSMTCRPSGRVRPGRVAPEEPVDVVSRHTEEVSAEDVLNELCEVVVNNPDSSEQNSSIRAYCRERRNQLSRKGKLALPGKAKKQAIESLVRQSAGSSLTGRAVAKLHRESRCQFGRGDSSGCRPSGRVRPARASSKVEVGTTLSGQAVTGTQVEQTEKITGIESGACRVVTGTEYLGVEQFESFCSSVPEPAVAKVGLSKTSHGQLMTGLAVADSEKVTGDEAGGCKRITGSEYLGVEHFEAACNSASGINRTQDKVVADRSGKDLRITGVDEARDNDVTGLESGAGIKITGTEYVINKEQGEAPAKVQESHTAAGVAVSVSGGDVSRVDITGDEQDACRRVTGTEYISSERFQATCGARPERPAPKVGIDSSQGGMSVTGNLVGRSEKVTGNEPGSCRRVTGSQYGASSDAGLCDNRSDKVHHMSTLHGRPLSGTEVGSSPKLTGDDRGGCLDVTGTEYLGQEHFRQTCSQTPIPGTEKTGVGYTWNNQPVSGTRVGPAQNVTGDEQGVCEPVTGSDYIGRDQVGEFCAPAAVQDSDRRQRHDTSVMSISGIQPGPDERIAGNFQRGGCQNITGTPYQGPGSQCTVTGENRQPRQMHHLVRAVGTPQVPIEPKQRGGSGSAESYQGSFSVMSPARTAWQGRERQPVHSSVYGVGGSITGVVNKAEGVISGTPEFRHPQELNAAPAVTVEPDDAQRERITGEGREAGTRITGDDWSRSNFVTGTEGMFSAKRNQTMRGASVERNNIGAHALKDRERVQAPVSRVTGGSGNVSSSSMVTLSGGASG